MRKATIALLAAAVAALAAYFLYWKLPLGVQVGAEFAGVDLEFHDEVIVKFLYVLQNNGAVPCALPASASNFFVRSRRTRALRGETNIIWPTGLRLPPEQRLEVAVTLRLPYSSDFTTHDADFKEKTKKFVENALADIEGFYVQGTLQCSSVSMDMPLKALNL